MQRTIHDILRQRLLHKAGIYEDAAPLQKNQTLAGLRISEWSSEFEQLMRSRLLMGRFRYGPLGSPLKGLYDNMASAERRFALYRKTGNQEHLVDIANLCLVEFIHPNHPNAHFSSEDDGEEHARPM